MLVSCETNVRASRTGPGATKCCAVQHPGQTDVQARGTTETSTLVPAVRVESTSFSWRVVRDPHGGLMIVTWRNTNELWESVYAKDVTQTGGYQLVEFENNHR